MCDPITLAILAGASIALSAAGVAVSTASAYQQTKAANAAAEYNAKIAERNQQIAEMQAQDAEQRGAIEESNYRKQLSLLKGQQRAGYAASGVTVDEGSALETLAETSKFGELDALTIRHNAAMEAWGFRNQGVDYGAQAELSRLSKRSAGMAATSTLLTGTGQLLGQAVSYGSAINSAGAKKAA